jgi:hypothetical protein
LSVLPHQPLRRVVNEQVRRLTERFQLEGVRTLPVLCECARPECTSRLDVPVDEYEAVCDLPDRFVVGPDHVGQLDTILEEREAYVIVQTGTRS